MCDVEALTRLSSNTDDLIVESISSTAKEHGATCKGTDRTEVYDTPIQEAKAKTLSGSQ